MVPEETGRCKKCGATDATSLLKCGKIRRFWDKLISFINSFPPLQLTKHPLPCLLLNFSDWDLGIYRKPLTPLLSIILTIAKQCILKHWIIRSSPFLHDIRAIIYYEHQKAFPDIEKAGVQFYKKWDPYISKLKWFSYGTMVQTIILLGPDSVMHLKLSV